MVSFRRRHIDQWLTEVAAPCIRGKVLDIGGKKKHKRGTFNPENLNSNSWEYLNSDPATEPDMLADATQIPAESNTFDTVLLCEILEHIEYPEQALAEAFRVLKPQGCCIITVPFLIPIHADPSDFARFTPAKLELLLKKQGFDMQTISAMGGLFSVISDLLRFAYVNNRRDFTRSSKAALKILFYLSRKLQAFDLGASCSSSNTTTGYGIIATKP